MDTCWTASRRPVIPTTPISMHKSRDGKFCKAKEIRGDNVSRQLNEEFIDIYDLK